MFEELDNLQVAAKQQAPNGWRPAVEFDALKGEGVATTSGLIGEPNYDEFLRGAGYDPDVYEVVGNTVRTSKWQQREGGDWLTSFRFTFRLKNVTADLPLLYALAKKTKPATPPLTASEKVLVIVPADYQIGKIDFRGGTAETIARIHESYRAIEKKLKAGKYEQIVVLDAGDIIEGISNKANLQQLASNDLSVPQQVDLAASLMWDLLKIATKYAPVTYASVGSNHCQIRVGGQAIGRPAVDDWGRNILQQLARLTKEVGLPVNYLVAEPEDESLAFDPFGDGFHVIGLVHGHQSGRPDGVPTWWEKQTFGQQPVAAATVLNSGHFHHLQVRELGASANGGSRYWIQASTSDSGSSWYRRTSGNDSATGIVCYELEKGKHFTGTVYKL
jgi:hypothetical protein